MKCPKCGERPLSEFRMAQPATLYFNLTSIDGKIAPETTHYWKERRWGERFEHMRGEQVCEFVYTDKQEEVDFWVSQ